MQQKHNVVHGTAARVPLSAAAASSVTSKVSSQPKKKPRGGVPALSCAECRRLKVKCSRTFPCTGCIKKGCPAICPDGQLTTRKGNRFVVADVNELQAKISELTNRAKQLEDALAKSHSIVSPQIHPLLSDDLLQVKQSMKANSTAPSVSTDSTTLRVKSEVEKEEDKDEALIVYNATLGSLRIKKRNIFYGRSSSSWHFLLNEGRTGQQEKLQKKQFLPNDLPWLVHSFPFSAPVDISTRQKLIGFLPGISVARRYYQNYYRYGAWHYSPISEIEFRTTIFQPWYEPVNNLYDDPLGAHRLSVLFIILALGCLLDLEGQFPSPEAKRYYQLSKASIALMSVLDSPSLSTIQALLLILYYMLLDNIHDSRYAIMGLVTKLTHAAGLHLDGTHWNLAPEETYRRRHLFWEVYSYDMLLSLTFGRPANISVYHIESKMPLETTIDANGNVEMTYTAWKHKFIGECLGVIWDKAFGAHPLSYDLLKHLDQQMRAYYIPPSLRLPGFGGVNPDQDVHPA
ncbi:hypothetical protein BT96DRAFT_692711 [Gymnopus androsaceus JB14]|uniref:Zn(2)-C6 fungal-type domain-containing protein n=1 Tax=Gymnopus androsaceus JB14 TaxID=1447944 RepID=A0A6A4GEU1_9AGAR|nr:hypothetical protein BT96DRAFT_692711 [Gymnopus androsaceus JB14]